MQRFLRIFATVLMSGLASLSHAADPASYTIHPDVVSPDVEPFTASILTGPRALRLRNTGFEPKTLRHSFIARRDHPNRVYADLAQLTWFGFLRGGVFDGAEIDVFRVINGEMTLVRSAKVPEGGHVADGGYPFHNRLVIDPGVQSFQYKWPSYARTGVPYYFTLQAIDRDGKLTEPSEPVGVVNPTLRSTAGFEYENVLNRPQVDLSGLSRRIGAPQNLTASVTRDGIATFKWRKVRRRNQGYVLNIHTADPRTYRGAWLELDGEGPEIRKNDMVFLRHSLYSASRAELANNERFDLFQVRQMLGTGAVTQMSDVRPDGLWELRKHEPDTPVEEPGETYLAAQYDSDTNFVIGPYTVSGSEQTFYPVLLPGEDYTVEFWMRGRATRPVEFKVTGALPGLGLKSSVRATNVAVQPEWTKHSFTIKASAIPETHRVAYLQLEFPGAGRVDIDNFRVYRSKAGYLKWSPEDLERLKASGMDALRTHSLIKLGLNGYSLEQLTNPGGLISATDNGATMTQNLELMQAVDMNPWLQIDPYLSRDEWLGLIEYLAAPYDPAVDTPEAKPWAAKRYNQGHTEPWVDVFDHLYFEIGNETWNFLFSPWVFNGMTDAGTGNNLARGTVYGLFQEYVLGVFRESPYWSLMEPKMRTVIGGWNGQDYGWRAAEASPNSDYMTLAFYNGGWDAGEGAVQLDPSSFASVLAFAPQGGLPKAQRHAAELDRISEARGKRVHLGTYEAGPGYALNGLNGESVSKEEAYEQELVMKSNAAGTATLDTFLMNAEYGMKLQNFFLYGVGGYWRSHAAEHLGGQTYPSWDVLALFNNVGTGDMLRVERKSGPTRDIDALGRRIAMTDVPMTAVYATRSGDRVTVFALSRRVEGFPTADEKGLTEMSIELPFQSAAKLTQHRMTGGYRANNFERTEAGMEQLDVAPPAPGQPLVINPLPPGEAMVFVFEGVTGFGE